jgi:hypothetical protein
VRIRFLADADLNKAILTGVLRREPTVDFLTAHAAGLRRTTDPEVLALAAKQGRVLVSYDMGTMPAHFRTSGMPEDTLGRIPRSAEPQPCHGNQELLIIWLTSDASEWENRLVWLPL